MGCLHGGLEGRLGGIGGGSEGGLGDIKMEGWALVLFKKGSKEEKKGALATFCCAMSLLGPLLVELGRKSPIATDTGQ